MGVLHGRKIEFSTGKSPYQFLGMLEMAVQRGKITVG
jgi:hypothetical protein